MKVLFEASIQQWQREVTSIIIIIVIVCLLYIYILFCLFFNLLGSEPMARAL